VSRKTIAFTMPAREPRAGEQGLDEVDRPSGRRAPLGADGPGAESDDWVRDRDFGRASEPASPALAAARASLVIDLAAERSLVEVMALSVLAPFALGWFWLMNAVSRRYRFWTG
jgi:hypothetical protein